MSTETQARAVTTDTAEPVTAPGLPADDRAGDGYDWIDTLEGTAWSVLPNWGSDGWDAGAWPYIIFAVARTRDWGVVRLRHLRRRRYLHPLVPVPGRLLRSDHRRGVLPLDRRTVRRTRDPPCHPRRTAAHGPEALPRLDGLETPPDVPAATGRDTGTPANIR